MTALIDTDRGHPPDSVENERPAAPEPALTIIDSTHRWQWLDARELWQFRELILLLAWRDIQVRYRQTLLGAAWALLQPLLMMVVFVVRFRQGVRRPGLPALRLPWAAAVELLRHGGQQRGQRLITKVYFPRLVVPFASVGAAGMDFLVASAFLGVLLAYYGVAPASTALLTPLLFALVLVCALGVGALLAALNVAYRDVRHAIPFLVQLSGVDDILWKESAFSGFALVDRASGRYRIGS